jgi:hypothetical protein
MADSRIRSAFRVTNTVNTVGQRGPGSRRARDAWHLPSALATSLRPLWPLSAHKPCSPPAPRPTIPSAAHSLPAPSLRLNTASSASHGRLRSAPHSPLAVVAARSHSTRCAASLLAARCSLPTLSPRPALAAVTTAHSLHLTLPAASHPRTHCSSWTNTPLSRRSPVAHLWPLLFTQIKCLPNLLGHPARRPYDHTHP